MSKFGRRNRQPPDGFDYLEAVLNALDTEIRESKKPIIFIIYLLNFNLPCLNFVRGK